MLPPRQSALLAFARKMLPCFLLPFAAYLAAAGTAPQFEPQRPVDLVINVFLERGGGRAPEWITVRLEDGFGSTEQEQRTDSMGKVQFHTKTGVHRIRIFGPGIQEYYKEALEIERVEVRHVENIYVRAKPSSNQPNPTNAGTGSEPVPAVRLRVPEKAQKEFHKGSQALERKEWAEARTRFEAAIALYPDYDVAYNGLGVARGGSGDQQAGRQAFEKAISLNPQLAEAYRNLSRISMSERKYEEADTLLTKSLDADPLNAWALTYAAYAELQLRKFSEAIAHARKAHALPHQGFASVHIVAACALEATQQPGEALAEYRRYLEEDPNGRDAARAREAVARLSSPTSRRPTTTPTPLRPPK